VLYRKCTSIFVRHVEILVVQAHYEKVLALKDEEYQTLAKQLISLSGQLSLK
jgi:hypothetical protein